MLRRLHDRLGTAGLIIAVIALVAALCGSAFAARGALTGKQKKEVKKIAKTYAGKDGKDGAQGPAGQNGAQGPKGDAGAAGADGKDGEPGLDGKPGIDGTNGTNGEDGESVTIIPLEVGDGNCGEGGAKFTNGSGSAYACNGKSGSGGDPTILPSGKTMKGYWELLGDAAVHFGPAAFTMISFPQRVVTAPTETILISFVNGNTEEEVEKCPGEVEAPEATPGVLCLYEFFSETGLTLNTEFGGPSEFGAALIFGETEEGVGSWAVKAP